MRPPSIDRPFRLGRRRFTHQQLLPVVGVRGVLDERQRGHGARLDHLGGQEDGGGAQELELLLSQPVMSSSFDMVCEHNTTRPDKNE